MNAAQFSRARERIERDDHKGEAFQRKALASLVKRSRAILFIHPQSGKVAGWRMTDGSMVCAMRRFPTRQLGENFMLAIQAQDGKTNAPRRVYPCDFCKGWHVSFRISIKED
jgi:hypothetical protein